MKDKIEHKKEIPPPRVGHTNTPLFFVACVVLWIVHAKILPVARRGFYTFWLDLFLSIPRIKHTRRMVMMGRER